LAHPTNISRWSTAWLTKEPRACENSPGNAIEAYENQLSGVIEPDSLQPNPMVSPGERFYVVRPLTV